VQLSDLQGIYDNNIHAGIEKIYTHADHSRTRLKNAGNDEFIVKMVNTAGHAAPQAGTCIDVGWSADDCRALDA